LIIDAACSINVQPITSNISPERYHYIRTWLYLPNPHFPRLNEILQTVGWAAVTGLSDSTIRVELESDSVILDSQNVDRANCSAKTKCLKYERETSLLLSSSEWPIIACLLSSKWLPAAGWWIGGSSHIAT